MKTQEKWRIDQNIESFLPDCSDDFDEEVIELDELEALEIGETEPWV